MQSIACPGGPAPGNLDWGHMDPWARDSSPATSFPAPTQSSLIPTLTLWEGLARGPC